MHRSTLRPVTTLLAFAALGAALASAGHPDRLRRDLRAVARPQPRSVDDADPGHRRLLLLPLPRTARCARLRQRCARCCRPGSEQHGRTNQRVVEIENRLALLVPSTTPAAAPSPCLRQRLGLSYGHAPDDPGRQAPTCRPASIRSSCRRLQKLTAAALAPPSGLAERLHRRAPCRRWLATTLDRAAAAQTCCAPARSPRCRQPRRASILRDLARRKAAAASARCRSTACCAAPSSTTALRLQPNLLQDRRFVDVYLQRLQPPPTATGSSTRRRVAVSSHDCGSSRSACRRRSTR
jgi:hypothetical protein